MADIYSINDPAQSGVRHNMYCIGEGYGTCETATATAGARAVSLQGYIPVRGFVAVRFRYAVPSQATMNVNNAGAYPIYRNGSAIGDGVIKDNDIAVFYFDNLYYNLVSVYKHTSEIDDLVLHFSDWYNVSSTDSIKTEGNVKYLLLEGDNATLSYDTIVNGTTITLFFGLQDGVAGLAQAGLSEFNIKFEDTSDTMLCIADDGMSPLPISALVGVKSVTAQFNSADDVFYVTGVVYDVTDNATQGSAALMTSGGVYSIVGDIESALDAIINGNTNSGGRA